MLRYENSPENEPWKHRVRLTKKRAIVWGLTMSRTWTGSIHVNERKIPDYNAVEDPYCVMTKSIPFSNHAKQFAKRSRNEAKRRKFERLGQSSKFRTRQKRKANKRKLKTARGRRLVS